MGGSVNAQAWLASGLAERGALVVSVNHAHSTSGEFDMAQGVNHWTRAQDLSAALESLLADPAFHFTAMLLCKPAGEAILMVERTIRFAPIQKGRNAPKVMPRSSIFSLPNLACEPRACR